MRFGLRGMGIGFGRKVNMVSSFLESSAHLVRCWCFGVVILQVLVGSALAETERSRVGFDLLVGN